MTYRTLLKCTALVLAATFFAACTPQQGTPAFTRATPTHEAATRTAMARANRFEPVSAGEGPCVGVADPTDVTVPADGGSQTWTEPETVIDPTHIYCAILTTDKGRIVAELYPQIAPTACQQLRLSRADRATSTTSPGTAS